MNSSVKEIKVKIPTHFEDALSERSPEIPQVSLAARCCAKNKSMISKVNTSQSFGKTIGYCMNIADRYEVLFTHGVSEEKKFMIQDFELQAIANKRIKVPVLHIILSHHPDDTDKIKGIEKEIVEAWINELQKDKKLDLYTAPFSVIKHLDRSHCHYHLVVSLVTYSGKRLKIDHIGLKAKDVSKNITKRYNLTPAVKREYQTAVIENNYQIKKAIDHVVNNSKGNKPRKEKGISI